MKSDLNIGRCYWMLLTYLRKTDESYEFNGLLSNLKSMKNYFL